MRKFNLKGNVAKKMMGIPDTPEKEEKTNASSDPQACHDPEYACESGPVRMAWRTDVGRLRKNNQDTVILGNGLIGVADGMGGHNGGEIASAGLRDGLLRETRDRKPDRDLLAEAVRTVNLELWNRQEQDANLTGMGTTLTILWPAEKEMIVGQVGDSRAYLIREGTMRQITADHSMVADMVRKGVLTEEQAACHPMRNYITRAVGTDDCVEMDLQTVPRETGDRWLVCSDGLYGMIGKNEMQRMALIDNLEEAADKLLETALENGGRDNISFILLQEMQTFTPAETKEDGTAAAEPDGEESQALRGDADAPLAHLARDEEVADK